MTNFLCLDVGSTWTKGALVAADGALLGTAQHETTPPEVLDGVAAVTGALSAGDATVLACSSAGGGLRLAVVGQERLVSTEAGHRVALSAGAKVVHVSAGSLSNVHALRAARPDVILLVGGTDGGDEKVLLHNATRLARARVTVPIVLAGNKNAQPAALSILDGRTVVPTDNVLPDVGELAPGPARAAIREVFLSHVIGGKGLSRGPRFRELVRTVTPDAVLSGVAVLASKEEDGAVLVVDVGGATTDVYSAVSADTPGLEGDVAPLRHARTVEGDLGLRSGARGVLAAAAAEGLLGDGREAAGPAAGDDLLEHVERAAADPGYLPADPAPDLRLAALAARIAARRHGRPQTPGGAPRPLRDVGLLVGSGGVLRHNPGAADGVLRPLTRDHAGGWAVPERARVAVDGRYVLFAAGLLAGVAPEGAVTLARGVAQGTMGG